MDGRSENIYFHRNLNMLNIVPYLERSIIYVDQPVGLMITPHCVHTPVCSVDPILTVLTVSMVSNYACRPLTDKVDLYMYIGLHLMLFICATCVVITNDHFWFISRLSMYMSLRYNLITCIINQQSHDYDWGKPT